MSRIPHWHDGPIGDPRGVRDGSICFDPISAIVGLGTSLIGGLIKGKAASSAAQVQSNAANAAGQQVTDAGAAAGKQVTDAAAAVNPTILDAAKTAGDNVTNTATTAATGVTDAAKQANLLLDPYATTGNTATTALNAGLQAGGQFNKVPTADDITIDPGYAFREQQGEAAQSRLAAARGGVMGGGAAKALEDYAQGDASQEYQAAYNRYQTSTQQRFNDLSTAANAGQAAVGTQGSNLINASTYSGNILDDASKYSGTANLNATTQAGANTLNANGQAANFGFTAAGQSADYKTQAANAIAAGKVGVANATSGAITGGGSSVSSALNLNSILKNPSTNYNLIVPPGYPTVAGQGA